MWTYLHNTCVHRWAYFQREHVSFVSHFRPVLRLLQRHWFAMYYQWVVPRNYQAVEELDN